MISLTVYLEVLVMRPLVLCAGSLLFGPQRCRLKASGRWGSLTCFSTGTVSSAIGVVVSIHHPQAHLFEVGKRLSSHTGPPLTAE